MIIKKSQKGQTKRYKKKIARKRSKEPSWHKKIPRERKDAFDGPVM